jgi:hypothetical protein
MQSLKSASEAEHEKKTTGKKKIMIGKLQEDSID